MFDKIVEKLKAASKAKLVAYIIIAVFAAGILGFLVNTFLGQLGNIVNGKKIEFDPLMFLSPKTWITGVFLVVIAGALLWISGGMNLNFGNGVFGRGEKGGDVSESVLENSRFMTDGERDKNFPPALYDDLAKVKKDGVPVRAIIDKKGRLQVNFMSGAHSLVIGATGSGKTTIADLICRIYNVADGCLFVDGKDVNTIPIKALRDRIAYVPQDNFLFGDTIENNIAFSLPYTRDGLTETDKEHVKASAKMSAVHDNIEEFPLTYQTILGERGVTISGGQKQRISIARALMKDSDILILDDSVSAVDTRTEKEILSNLERLRPGLTTILIAHRISTIEHMDRILFIDDGKVVAFGSHKELMESCEDYKALVAKQMLEDEEKKKEEEA